MSTPHSYCTIAKRELDEPESFLPTGLRYRDEELLWTTNAYATWRDTQIINETARLSTLRNVNDTITALPPNMDRISNNSTVPLYKEEYIQEYKHANAVLEEWIAEYRNDLLAGNALIIWKETCDKLLQNPNFTQGWHLPAFYPFYSYQCMASIENFFATNQSIYPNREKFWNKQALIANTMFSAWEPTYYTVCSAKRTPFPKCLWYHKYQYVHVRKQPQMWTNFFHDSPFSTWGRIMPGDREYQP